MNEKELNERELNKKKDLLHESLKKFEDFADINEDSDIPITEKKTKEKEWIK
jgi:hypothetical protein